MKWPRVLLSACASVIILAAVALRGFWYPGLTTQQTATILLNDQKFAIRAYSKAKWHGVSIIQKIREQTSDFEILDYQKAKITARLLNDIDTSSMVDDAEVLYSKSALYPRLMGALILAKSSPGAQGDIFQFLADAATRSLPGMEQNLYRAGDYYSEIAIIALGNLRGDNVFQLLVMILQENDVPYARHSVVCRALASFEDDRAISVLRDRMVDGKFHATLPAFEAMVQLGDGEARQFAERRLAMLPDENNKLLRLRLME